MTEAEAHEKDRGSTASPPYVSYVTFRNFLNWLKEVGIPVQIDRSFWEPKFSGSTGVQLIAGLRFLGLLDGEKPAQDLHNLVDTELAEERKAIWRRILKARYTAVPWDTLGRATPRMLEEALKSYGIDGDTLRKAGSFLINACKEADIDLPTSIRKKARMRGSPMGSRREHSRGRKGQNGSVVPPKSPPIPPVGQTDNRSWEDKLLDKFPTFDPTWPDDVKAKWFSAFDQLMTRRPSKEDP